MLPNYDAIAIAEVMGLAFLRGVQQSAASSHRVRNGNASLRRVLAQEFVIHVDDAIILIVEMKPKSTWTPFDTPKAVGSRPSRFASHASPASSVIIEKAVENGLPRQALRHVAEWLAGDDRAKVSALEWGVVPKTTLDRRETKLSPQESERTERIARLVVHARRALGTAAEAREFMTTSHPELDGRSPIEAAKTDLGTRRVEQLLTALEYGLAL